MHTQEKITVIQAMLGQRGDLTKSYDKSPYTNRKAKWQHKQRHKKSSIKQQLCTDLGRSVGVTTATQLVWLTWFTGPPSHSPQQPCNQKDKQIYTQHKFLDTFMLFFLFNKIRLDWWLSYHWSILEIALIVCIT